MFFLATRLQADIRNVELLGYWSACIAARPDHGYLYINRAEAHRKSKQLAAAQSDYTSAIANVRPDVELIYAHWKLLELYQVTGQKQKQGVQQGIAIRMARRVEQQHLEKLKQTDADLGQPL